jgi:tripartite-type tricarboxylate transporter receptor subunit TctC
VRRPSASEKLSVPAGECVQVGDELLTLGPLEKLRAFRTWLREPIIGAGTVIEPFVVFGPGARIAERARIRSFSHIAMVITNPSVWVVNKDSGINSLADLVRQARTRRGGLDMASSGAGSSNHLLIVRFCQQNNIDFTHVPFRGAGPAMTAVISGQVPMMSDSLPSAAGHIRQGSVRAIAMSSAERHPSFPDVPTFREQGFDLVSTSWFSLSGPAGMPAPIVERLHRETMAVVTTPEARARFAELGGSPDDMTPEQFTAFVAAEVAAWAPVVRASGATVD